MSHSCWNVKAEFVGSGHELTTPILIASEDSYNTVKEIMKRYGRNNVGYNITYDAVHVHVDFPNEANSNKLIFLFANIEPVLAMLNTRTFGRNTMWSIIRDLKNPNLSQAKKYFKDFHANLFDDRSRTCCLDQGNKGMAHLRAVTYYRTAEFRSVIDLTWDPEINVQNIILSQTIIKIANLP
jgi:hypothetical protein